ncbi:MAG: hypothetical protein ACE5R6_07030 [Candidatus Heimdallarchaeota archaeon]
MAPKSKTRKKKKQRTKNSEPDGKNSMTVEAEGALGGEKLLSNYNTLITSEITWDTFGGVPCFTCINLKKCGVRQPISPVSCPSINSWLECENIPLKESQLRPQTFDLKTVSRRNTKLERVTSLKQNSN